MSHTSGPWQADANQVTCNGGTTIIADCYSHSRRTGSRPPEEQTANAVLIAAAPDLLAALKRSIRHFDVVLALHPDDGVRRLAALCAEAIARAEGRTP